MHDKTNTKIRARQKTASLLLAMILLLAGFTTACQTNPTTPPVLGKQQGVDITVTDNPESGNPIATVPPKVQRESITKGKLTLNMDATLDLPGISEVPVVKVVPDRFTQEATDKIVAALMKGKPLYEASEIKTKAELQKELIVFKARTARGGKKGGSTSDIVADMEKAIAEAPETVEKIPAGGKLEDVKEQDEKDNKGNIVYPGFKGQKLDVTANLGFAYDASLKILSSESAKDCSVHFTNQDATVTYDYTDDTARPGGIKMSLDEAKALARTTLDRLGAKDLKLAYTQLLTQLPLAEGQAKDSMPQAYLFVFTREVNGLPTTYDANDTANDENNYYQHFAYERVFMTIDDTGIAEFTWNSPMKLSETLSSNAKILGFEEVMNILEKQFFIHRAPKDDTYVYTITKITLGFMRLPVKDKPDEFILVPVWDFFGSYKKEFTQPVKDINGNTITSYENDCPDLSFFTINAIDGTVIDRGAGF